MEFPLFVAPSVCNEIVPNSEPSIQQLRSAANLELEQLHNRAEQVNLVLRTLDQIETAHTNSASITGGKTNENTTSEAFSDAKNEAATAVSCLHSCLEARKSSQRHPLLGTSTASAAKFLFVGWMLSLRRSRRLTPE